MARQNSELPESPKMVKGGQKKKHSESVDVPALHGLFHQAMQLPGDRSDVFRAFRTALIEHAPAIGVAMIGRSISGGWTMDEDSASGRFPTREDIVKRFGQTSEMVWQRGSIQMERFLGLESIYVPIVAGENPLVIVILTQSQHTQQMLMAIEVTSVYLNLYIQSIESTGNNWKIESLAAIIDLVTQIERQSSVDDACHLVTNELVRHLEVGLVAVGCLENGLLRVKSISGTTRVQRHSETHRAIELALNESLLRNEVGLLPSELQQDSHLLLAHRQLCTELNAESAISTPLFSYRKNVGESYDSFEDPPVGALILIGDAETIKSQTLTHFLTTAAPRIGSAIEVCQRAQRHRIVRATNRGIELAKSQRGITWGLVCLFVVAMMMMPIRYRVRCGCETQPTLRRFAVAPFEGQIERGFVNTGDIVKKGELLARMDGQSVRFELAGTLAEKNQAAKKREIELSNRDITASLLSQLEAERLHARAELLRHQLEQLEIRSPIDGVVLNGSVQRAAASAVSTGDVVYEIGDNRKMRVEVAIPAEEVAHVDTGQPIRIWFDGMASRSFDATVERVNPESELRDGKNVFIALVTLENDDERLRPGMSGNVRIDCERHSLAWNLFHRPWEYLVSRLTWW